MPTFRTIMTQAGLEMIATAEVSGVPVELTEMAVGDGAGNPTTPSESQTTLIRELFRASINTLVKDVADPTKFTAELVIPASEGGFTIREGGLFASDGRLFAVCNLPATYKPEGSEGAFSDTIVRMVFIVTNADVVSLVVDPNVAVATQAWVLNNLGPELMIPGGTTNQVLMKNSNIDGDVDWRDPTDVTIAVNAVREIQTAADGQDTFILSTLSTTGTAVYIEGIREFYYTALDDIRIKLDRTLPEGTQVMFVQNDPAAPYLNRLQRPGFYFMAQF